MTRSLIVGIAGGTASGKTTLAHSLAELLGNNATLIAHDNYYRAHNDMTYEQRSKLNYDHPDAYETDLLVQHLSMLKDGKPVEVPIYDFSQHNRIERTICVKPTPAIILEGILLFADERLRNLLDIKVFVYADDDVRILRRLARDVSERGRTIQSVIEQYLTTVKPMHRAFVEPSKDYADIVVPGVGSTDVALNLIASEIQRHISNAENDSNNS